MAEEENPTRFVKWREEFVSQERGSRLVHFYLEDSDGESHLAIVGTERSLRHMLYVAAEDFCVARFGFCDKSRASSLKWRSRREAVDWLSSLLTMKNAPQRVGLNGFLQAQNGSPRSIKEKDGRSDIVWSGSFWVCGKQLNHYHAFSRNGITIPAHSFAFILSEEANRYLAYIEDMYEDKKGQKKVKVRWFHQNMEFDRKIPPPPPHPREVFITPYTQVISAECVDDIATVLTPSDFSLLSSLPSPALLCFRQYAKSKFRYFDLRSLKGYFSQPALLRSAMHPRRNNLALVEPRGPRNQLKPPYEIRQKVEVLCMDSGIRGCWFRCEVVELCHKFVKVRYQDLIDPDDTGSNLEEWVRAYRFAEEDRLGIRKPSRPTIRPAPEGSKSDSDDVRLVPGSAVDVWRDDGWWEGVLVFRGSERSASSIQVYFPAEGIYYECERKDVRVSKDWVNNQWVDLEPKPECLTLIPPSNPKRVPGLKPTKRADSGSSVKEEDGQVSGRKRSRDEAIEE
ncbi:hypothetical protein LUZ60_006447 [Juncus effusus]|nr:hypothetical protein LUZ60_006447 [Juncus effusus]